MKTKPNGLDGSARLESELSLERLIESRGITITTTGKSASFVCPFHEGGEPAVLDRRGNTWSCPTCAIAGEGVVGWTARTKGVSKRHAIELLQSDSAVEKTGPVKAVKRITRQTLPTPFPTSSTDSSVLGSVAAYYHDALKRHADPTTLLTEMDLTSAEVKSALSCSASGC